MGRKQRKRWSYSAGERPDTVRVAERTFGAPVQVEVWDPNANDGEGRQVRKSLGFRIRDDDGELIPEAVDRAEQYAKAQSRRLARGRQVRRDRTVARVFARYRRRRSPEKGDKSQGNDKRRARMWCRFLGGATDPHDVDLDAWDRFKDRRASGAIDARGRRVPAGDRVPVGPRTVEADGRWLLAVFNWATAHRDDDGEYLMEDNPAKRFINRYHVPQERNPQRAAVTEERHRQMREAAASHRMRVRWNGGDEYRRSHLLELLDLANGTGRRIGSICALRFSDLHLERTPDAPHGAITWREEDDKEGYEWERVPIDAEARGAIDRIVRDRPAAGDVPLFPAPYNPTKPMRTDLACGWWKDAEEGIDLPPMPKNRTWHGYRAKFATETKHLADRNRAFVGGWKSTETIRRIYDQQDPDGVLEVVRDRRRLREGAGEA